MSKKRVLITGRHGFTGRYAAEALSTAGWDVWGINSSLLATAGPTDYTADLTDKDAVTDAVNAIKPDAVLHLAAIAFVAHGDIDDFYNVNLVGTRNLLEALASGGYGSQGVVLASSANIYGNTRLSPIVEETQPAPANDYAVSKLAMEYVAALFKTRLPITVARPFNYTGVGQDSKFLVPKIVTHFRERADQIELGNLDVARDFSDVRDVAKAYALLLATDAAHGEIVNICSGNATSLGDLLEKCKTITGHDIEVVVNPDFVRSDEIKTLTGSSSKLETIVGSLNRYSLDDTLTWMLD